MISPIHVNLKAACASSYPIWIGSGLLENIALWMPKISSTLVIITDEHVSKHYALAFEQALKSEGYHTLLLSFPAGEKAKNRVTKSNLEEKMLAHSCDRDTVILALGGGVVGDLAGFVAATYMRGIAYIQMPTTLLAMLDSSVGGKTGIDTPQGKNLIGAFWQPIAVILDLNCLKTLNQEHLINGLIEAIKIFLTSDFKSLNDLEENLNLILSCNEKALSNLLCQAVTLKATMVMQDEREQGQRAVLNFGHTIGHALEKLSDYQVLHGYAVALGLLVESKIAQLMGFLEVKNFLFIQTLLQRLNITAKRLKKFDVNEVIQCTLLDKKKRAGLVRYVLLKDLGSVYAKENQFTHPVPDEVVKRAFLELIED